MKKEQLEGLGFVALISLLAFLIVGVEKDDIATYVNVFISAMNVIVMGILTYFIYKVNVEVAKISENSLKVSENSLKVTKKQLISLQKNETNALIGKLDEYLKANELVMFFSLPYLKHEQQREYLFKMYDENYMISNEIAKEKLFPIRLDVDIRVKTSLNQDYTPEENERMLEINHVFSMAMPNSIWARYKLKDALMALEYLKSFKVDGDFYRFRSNANFIKDHIEMLENLFSHYFNINPETLFPDCNIRDIDAMLIQFFTMETKSFFENLKGLILQEQIQYEKELKID